MNETIFKYLNNFAGQSQILDGAIVFCADTLGIILLFCLILFLFSYEHKKQGFYNIVVVLGAAFLAYVVAYILKNIYPSPRPFIALDNVHKLIDHGGIDSFPSGHATFFSAVATALYFYHKKIAFFYAIGALIIGLSRIIAGIHWPFDILGGYILGGIIAILVYRFYINIR
jgi:undecaprenyl-diphosphatase